MVSVEIVEPKPFCPPVHPVFFRDLFTREPLREARDHGLQFCQCGLTLGGVACAVLLRQITHEVGTFQDHASARRGRGQFSEIPKKRGIPNPSHDPLLIADVLFCKLDDWTRFHVAVRADVVRYPGGHGTERLAVMSVIRVDDTDRHAGAHFHNEPANLDQLFGPEGELGIHVGANGAIGVIPDVVDPLFDQLTEPGFGQQFLDIRLAYAGGHTGEQTRTQRGFQAPQRTFEDVYIAAAFVADDLVPLDGDEWCGIADFRQTRGDFVGDALAVGEDLKIAVGVVGENVEQTGVEEGLSAENAEESVPLGFGVVDESVHLLGGDLMCVSGDVDPTTLAAQIAAVEDRDVEEGRKELAFLQTLFEPFDAEDAFHPKVPQELSDATRRRGAQDAESEIREHGGICGVDGRHGGWLIAAGGET